MFPEAPGNLSELKFLPKKKTLALKGMKAKNVRKNAREKIVLKSPRKLKSLSL